VKKLAFFGKFAFYYFMDTNKAKASYGVGMSIAESLAQQDLTVLDLDQVLAGMTAIFSGSKPLLSPEEANVEIQQYLNVQKALKYEANKQAGAAFLNKNAQRTEVTTTESGLQYEIIQAGDGPKPGPTQVVKCHYHGTLIDGRVFDSSVQRGQPASFPLNRVIPGWTEALQLMGVGSKWRLFLPPNLAYGDRQVSAEIGPNSTLIFEVELLGIG
jgi:FKBP-type peptidyl-prolyl cis-trans isomerase FklB